MGRQADSWASSTVLRDDPAIAKTLLPFRTSRAMQPCSYFQNRNRLAEAVHDVVPSARHAGRARLVLHQVAEPLRGDRLPDDYALPTDRPSVAKSGRFRRSLSRARASSNWPRNTAFKSSSPRALSYRRVRARAGRGQCAGGDHLGSSAHSVSSDPTISPTRPPSSPIPTT